MENFLGLMRTIFWRLFNVAVTFLLCARAIFVYENGAGEHSLVPKGLILV